MKECHRRAKKRLKRNSLLKSRKKRTKRLSLLNSLNPTEMRMRQLYRELHYKNIFPPRGQLDRLQLADWVKQKRESDALEREQLEKRQEKNKQKLETEKKLLKILQNQQGRGDPKAK